MDEQFCSLLDEDKRVAEENRIFPHPSCPEKIGTLIEELGGVDICFGGVGINGHLAFNEPPDPSLEMTAEEFAACLPGSSSSITAPGSAMPSRRPGGNIEAMPRLAITVGMKEILAARSVHIYLNRSWQAAVVRRMIHGPVTAQVPASLLQNHPDVRCVMIPEAAELPLAFSE